MFNLRCFTSGLSSRYMWSKQILVTSYWLRCHLSSSMSPSQSKQGFGCRVWCDFGGRCHLSHHRWFVAAVASDSQPITWTCCLWAQSFFKVCIFSQSFSSLFEGLCILRTILQLCRPGSETQLLLAYQPRAKEDQNFLKEEPQASSLKRWCGVAFGIQMQKSSQISRYSCIISMALSQRNSGEVCRQ